MRILFDDIAGWIWVAALFPVYMDSVESYSSAAFGRFFIKKKALPEEDLDRFALLQQYDCNVYAMMFRDLTGKIGVDGRGKPQSAHVKPFRDWVNGKVFRNVPFEEFDRYQKTKQATDPMTIFDIVQAI